ncbi:hypothetical protein C5F49_00775 [Nitrosopumilus oxyclinae]|uniref:N-acetyltransferase domain-containing protein n=1 Tax=Nitrosopumilus oxyclinae TaxID=1959104 RepID=A0A7D5R225_9ARCH|nr:GNAT family N-acetyltransferase [Nitrosopumilus oxyclinae]QLH04018.1 hypothetical protein C5F49_00775 [Nitrosopumilus oxyclinae]
MITLREISNEDIKFLFGILNERNETTNFSNNNKTEYKQHVEFVNSKPYKKWYIIEHENEKVGSINLDHNNGIGTFILKKYQRNGFASKAIREIIRLNPEKKYYANINPNNQDSIKLYTKCGFGHIYNHYELNNDE